MMQLTVSVGSTRDHMLLRCVTWWKRGKVILVINTILSTLRLCWIITYCLHGRRKLSFRKEGENRPHRDQKWPKKAEVIIYVLTQGVWLKRLVFLRRSNSHLRTRIKVLSILFTFLCTEKENKDGNALECFSILTSKHFLCLETQLWPF